MATTRPFYWRGLSLTGQACRGLNTAVDELALQQKLRDKRIVVERATPLPRWLSCLLQPTKRQASATEVAQFLRGLATLTDAGIPMVQGLEMMAREADRNALSASITQIREDVAAGTPLSVALSAHPSHFNERICALVRAGEQASTLDTLLTEIAHHEEQAAHMTASVRRVLRYPVAVLAIALLVSSALVVFVIPRFESMFQGFDAELPALTRALMDFSAWVRTQGWLWGLGLAATGITVGILTPRVQWLHGMRDRWILRLPLFGPILKRALTARFVRTLAIMTEASMPIAEALPGIAKTMGNQHYEQAVHNMADTLRAGLSLERVMVASQCFPEAVTQMVAVGEETGRLTGMLNRIAVMEESRVEESIAGLGSAMEPFIMVGLGLMIGGLVLAMYLPVFQLGAAV
ncbi:MAG: type II secretion system F family protein [Spiribacter sp.]|jgi:type IV pilus assembly protein PilC|nr:type II secretion system F family protein [Spiribacter sp.]MDR9489446.1 type II secretion system F family protein [Spiribacter sp.]